MIHFASYFPPDERGGVGRFSNDLHAGLRRCGVDSRVVTRGRGESADGIERIARTRLGWFLGVLRWVRRAAAADVVHCHTGEALPLLLALRLWPGRRARSLVTFHTTARGMRAAERPYVLEGRRFGEPAWRRPRATLLGWLHGGVEALARRLADGINTICRATAVDLLGPARGAAVPVIYNGVAPVPPGGRAGPPPVELLFAGIGSHLKRVTALPFLLARVRRAMPDARLRIAGFHAHDAPRLRALFTELGVADAVEWAGPVPPDVLSELYRAAGVVVVPSAYEGLPYVLLEAMAHGAPVVATRVSGHPEAIRDGVDGYLVPVDDPAALADRCTELLRDGALAERIGAAARETVARRFRLDAQVDAYIDYYRALAAEET